MKKTLFLITLGLLSLLAFDAAAQAPASIRGKAIFQTITSGDGTIFDTSGYTLIFPANSANTYQRVNVLTGETATGSFNYAASAADATLAITDGVAGKFSADYTFSDGEDGTFAFNQTSSSAFQSGSFKVYDGTAPASLVGKTVVITLTDGGNGDDSSGTITVVVGAGTLQVTDVDGTTHSSAYSFSALNQSTLKISASGSAGHSTIVALAFADAASGGFALHDNTGGWQTGTFMIPDTTRPTITITAPTPNQHWSNDTFIVTGKAGDNVAVSEVEVSTDGVNWLPANGTTNWTASVSLNPGANTILAYAVDGSGNVSVTNRVNVTYIVSGSLTVNLNGRGTITPNDTNATLQVGNRYTITATPAVGFGFVNWTDSGDNYVTNKPALNFLMADGLVFNANFVDVAKPVLSITNLPVSGKVSNDTFTVKGKTADNEGVVAVLYNLNNGGWNPNVSSGNNLTNWSADLTLVPGSNTIAAYARDAAGNVSLTNTVRLTYILSAPLTVSTSGRGTIAPNYNNASLQISNRYTMTATPAVGFGFVNWTDGNDNLVTTNKILAFTMASNLVYVANFVDVQKPVVTVTTPTAATIAASEFFPASGKASDNGSVTNVWCQLNHGTWFNPSGTNNWTVTLDLMPGTNYFAAYAVDTSGNVSATNNTKFIYITASTTLNGLLATITPDGGTPFGVAFGATTFSQASADTNNVNAVGKYTYTKETPSSGVLKVIYTAPPSTTNDNLQNINLTFIAPNVARFTNNTDTGGITFTPTPKLVATTLANQTVIAINSDGHGNSLHFSAGKYVSTNLLTGTVKSGVNQSYAVYSPLGALVKDSSTNGTSYTVISFLSTNYGISYSEDYDPAGNFQNSTMGVFGLAAQRVNGNAPTNLVSRTVVVTADSGASQLNFADSVNFSDVNPLDNSVVNGVGTYTYGPPSTNSASLDLNYSSPVQTTGYDFVFVSPNFAIFTNADNTLGSAVVK